MVVKGHGRDRNVTKGQRDSFAAIVTLQETSQAGDRKRHRIKLQAVQQFCGARLFLRPHAGIYFRYVDGTTSKQVALLRQAGEQLPRLRLLLSVSMMTLVSRR